MKSPFSVFAVAMALSVAAFRTERFRPPDCGSKRLRTTQASNYSAASMTLPDESIRKPTPPLTYRRLQLFLPNELPPAWAQDDLRPAISPSRIHVDQ